MLSLSHVSAAQAENYYEQDDYYTSEDETGFDQSKGEVQWFGRGAIALGLGGDVQKPVFQNLLQGYSPQGKCLQGRKVDPKKHRAATDYTFSAPKSVSIAGLIQGDQRAIAAHDQAVKMALTILEERYIQTRISTPEGRQRIKTGNLTAAIFRHETSREQDPQLHSHCVVINSTQLPDGTWRSISNEEVLANQKLLGEIYQNELAYELRRLGYGVEPLANGQFELSGYDSTLLDIFSTRTRQIETYIAQWESHLAGIDGQPLHASQKKQATLQTRCKKQVVPRGVLLAGWREAIAAQNLTLSPIPNEPLAQALVSPQLSDSTRSGIDHAAEREAVFRRGKVERFVLENHLGQQSFGDLQQAIAATNQLISIDPLKDKVTTQQAIQRELETIRLMQRGQGKVGAIATAEDIEKYLEEAETLTEGQRQAIVVSATIGDRVMAWQGVAGAGKTYSLRLFRELAASKGYVVKGFAPSAEAANSLTREAGLSSDTVASLLCRQSESEKLSEKLPTCCIRPLNPPILGDFELQPPSGLGGREAIQAKIGTVQTPSEHLFEPEIWIVDEAGLLSARDAHALLMKAEAQQARVILVGDTRQLSAVEAGNPFRSLQAAGIQTVYLSQSRRQKTQVLKTAVNWMSQGRMAEGLQVLAQGGAITAVQNADKRLTRLVQDYLNGSPEEQKQTLLLATTNQERLAMAARLREALQGEGRLGSNQVTLDALRSRNLTSVQAQYAACYQIGDVLVPSQDYKRQGLQKAEQYAVVQVDWRANRLVLETPEKQLIRVNPAACDRKSVYQVQQLPVAQGDRLRWTRNQRVAGIRNGQVVTVAQVDATGTAGMVADDGRRIQVDLNERQYLDYAWVSTVYGSQGKTAERVLAAIEGVVSREGLYVMASRARSELMLYTVDRAELIRRGSVSRAKENPSDYISLIQGRYDDGQTAQIPVESTTVGADARSVAECVGSRVGKKLTAAFCRGGGVESTHRAIGTDNRAVESRLAPELEPLSTAIAGAVARRQLNQCVGEFAAAVEAVNFGVESLESAAAGRVEGAAAVAQLDGGLEAANRNVIDGNASSRTQELTKRQYYLRLWQHYSRGLGGCSLRQRDLQVARRAAEAGMERRAIALMLIAGSGYVRQLDERLGKGEARVYVNRVAEETCRQWIKERRRGRGLER